MNVKFLRAKKLVESGVAAGRRLLPGKNRNHSEQSSLAPTVNVADDEEEDDSENDIGSESVSIATTEQQQGTGGAGSGRRRRAGVRFNLKKTKYHSDKLRDMGSQEEWDKCWYNADAIKSFRMEQMQMAQSVFEDHFRLPPEQAAMAKEWKSTLHKVFEACRKPGPSSPASSPASSSSSPVDEQSSSAIATVSAVNDDEDDSASAVEVSLTVSISEEEEEEEASETELEQMYVNAADTLVGLETNMLARIRGKAARECKSILQQMDQRASLMAAAESSLSSSVSFDSNISDLTLPSSNFAHQVAVAHAKALRQEEEEEEAATERKDDSDKVEF